MTAFEGASGCRNKSDVEPGYAGFGQRRSEPHPDQSPKQAPGSGKQMTSSELCVSYSTHERCSDPLHRQNQADLSFHRDTTARMGKPVNAYITVKAAVERPRR